MGWLVCFLMEQGPLAQTIVDAFEGLSGQFKLAARYVLDHPRDVALLSMREQARRANVQPATMTRLAKHLGLSGYEQLRAQYAKAVREGELGFARRAGVQVKTQKLKGDAALVAEMTASLGAQMSALGAPAALETFANMAQTLAGARRIYCLGLRSSFGAAWHFSYILSLLGETCHLLDAPAGTGTDDLRGARKGDALMVVSVAPYTRATVEIAQFAADNGLVVCAVTDSTVAPLAAMASQTLVVPTASPSFFHTMAPAYAAAEMLAVLVAGHGGEAALEALKKADAQMAALNTHLYARTEGAQ